MVKTTTVRVIVALSCVLGLFAGTVFAAELELIGSGIVSSPGRSGRGLSLSPDGKMLYAAGIQDHWVVKLDLASEKVVATTDLLQVDAGAYGKSVWVDAGGDVWAPLTQPIVAVFSSDLVLKASYNLSSFGVVAPEGTAVSASGEVYVTDRKGKGGVYKFLQESGKLVPDKSWGDNGHVSLGNDLRQPGFTPQGDLLVGSFGGKGLYKVAASDGKITAIDENLTDAYHVVADAAGKIYVAHYGRFDAAVTVYNPDGSVFTKWTPADLKIQTETSGIAVSDDGSTIYVLDQRTGQGGIARVFKVK